MMNAINLITNILIDPLFLILFSSLLLIFGYTWTNKTSADEVGSADFNLIQNEKQDRDGEIPLTGTDQWDWGANIASAATLLPGCDGNAFYVTGTTKITAINAARSQPGTVIYLRFASSLIIEHDNDDIILPGGIDIQTKTNDIIAFIEYAADKWICSGFVKPIPVPNNILENSEIKVWSQSDTNKGLGTLGYDAGSAGGGNAPDVGDVVVGDDSGATGKIISYTIASGAFATNDAAGILTLGACTGRFHDNEGLTFEDGETAVVNAPDTSAINAGDLVQNGDFSVDTDPPNGWTSSNNAVLTTEAGGQIGNCLQVAVDGIPTANGRAISVPIVTESGRIHKAKIYFKKGTGTAGKIYIGSTSGGSQYYDSGAITDAAWTVYTKNFKATSATTYITLYADTANGAGLTSLYDEISLYVITPCCTGADVLAMDKWGKEGDPDLYREHSGVNTKDGSFYSLKIVPTTAGGVTYFPTYASSLLEHVYKPFWGRRVCSGLWIKAFLANHVRLAVYDNVSGFRYSQYHTGGGGWEWLENPATVGSTAIRVHPFWISTTQAGNVDGTTIVYANQLITTFGSSIGEGNYQPKQQEFIYTEVPILSLTYNNTAGWSDLAYTDLDIEADSDARLPKGCKAILVHTGLMDSGSGASVDAGLYLRSDATFLISSYANAIAGKTDNIECQLQGKQGCDINGDVDIRLEATGAGTLDIVRFEYHGVQVN